MKSEENNIRSPSNMVIICVSFKTRGVKIYQIRTIEQFLKFLQLQPDSEVNEDVAFNCVMSEVQNSDSPFNPVNNIFYFPLKESLSRHKVYRILYKLSILSVLSTWQILLFLQNTSHFYQLQYYTASFY